MSRTIGRRARLLLERNEIFVPGLILVVLVLVLGLARVLTVGPIFTPQTGPAVTPLPTHRTPSPLTGPAPNFVFILTDDQRADDIDVMPNLRRLLIDHGTTFRNTFAATPLCCPSRATILTGQLPYHTRVYDNSGKNGGVRAFDHRSSLGTWLQAAGYTTSYIGKYLNGYEQFGARSFVPPGWNDWHGAVVLERGSGGFYYDYGLNENGEFNTFGSDPEDYGTTVFTDRAVDFIRDAQSPFFLHFAAFAPHLPAVAAPGDEAAFANVDPLRPASYDVRASEGSPAARFEPLPETLRGIVDSYRRRALASLLAVDRAIADIYEAVRSRGQLDNTIFIFMSDNGVLMGEHRIFGKAWAYEPSIRLPLIVKMPGDDSPRVVDDLVLNTDIAPTISELADAPPRPKLRMDGESLVPLLRGEPVEWRQEIPLMYLGDGDPTLLAPPRFFAVRTSRYKLIAYQDGSRELFDLERDPDELNNLAGTEAATEIEAPLYERLLRLTPSGYIPKRSRVSTTPPPAASPDAYFRD